MCKSLFTIVILASKLNLHLLFKIFSGGLHCCLGYQSSFRLKQLLVEQQSHCPGWHTQWIARLRLKACSWHNRSISRLANRGWLESWLLQENLNLGTEVEKYFIVPDIFIFSVLLEYQLCLGSIRTCASSHLGQLVHFGLVLCLQNIISITILVLHQKSIFISGPSFISIKGIISLGPRVC